MRTIIAGSRTLGRADLDRALAVCQWTSEITEVVSGRAPGIDRHGEAWAEEHGIPVHKFPAHWQQEGSSAGPKRNAKMARYAEALIAVWDGTSRGTKNMIEQANKRGLRVFVFVKLKENNNEGTRVADSARSAVPGSGR